MSALDEWDRAGRPKSGPAFAAACREQDEEWTAGAVNVDGPQATTTVGDEPGPDDTTTRAALSAFVRGKAAALAVSYAGDGRFTVASGSEPGKTYTVTAPYRDRDPRHWTCSCPWGGRGYALCSHVRAAARWLQAADARRARRARRMELAR